MNLHFEPVTKENRTAIEQLRILPEQNGFIESVKDCLKEADLLSSWRPVGIFDGELLVGFAMYGYFEFDNSQGKVWLDRLLIDQKHQRKGYGKAAILALLERLHQEYGQDRVFLSVYESNATAVDLYRRLGFRFNGKLDTKGEKVMVYERTRKR